MYKWGNQFGRAIDHKAEFQKLKELNKDLPNFEDDPAADGADKTGSHITRSLADGKLLTGVDMGNFRGNGEKPQ